MSSRWTEDEIPDLSGETAVVTGANAGLGFQIASVLADPLMPSSGRELQRAAIGASASSPAARLGKPALADGASRDGCGSRPRSGRELERDRA